MSPAAAFPPTAERPLLTPKEVAAALAITRPTVRQLAKDGVLPCVRLGRLLRFDPQALAQFRASGGKGFARGWRRSEGDVQKRRDRKAKKSTR